MGRMCKLRRLDTLDNLNDILYVRIGGYIYIYIMYVYIYIFTCNQMGQRIGGFQDVKTSRKPRFEAQGLCIRDGSKNGTRARASMAQKLMA